MNRHYDDLLTLADRKPSFFQQGGVPRWTAFQAGDSTSPYTVDCAIVEIACQLCDMRFHVLMESGSRDKQTILERIRAKSLWYLDPPNVGCCRGGTSMTSETVRVLEYWERAETFQWKRNPEAEVAFRRSQDPWTEEMRARAAGIIADPEIEEQIRSDMKAGLEADDERRSTAVTEPEPQYATEFVSAS